MKDAASRSRPNRSNSRIQGETAQRRVLAKLSSIWPMLTPTPRIQLATGETVCPDAVVAGRRQVLVEVSAHVGILKDGQRDKLVSDAFKLVFLRSTSRYRSAKLVLVVAEDGIRRQILSGWRGAALRALKVEVRVVKLGAALRREVRRWQRLQDRTRRFAGKGHGA